MAWFLVAVSPTLKPYFIFLLVVLKIFGWDTTLHVPDFGESFGSGQGIRWAYGLLQLIER